MAAHLLYTEDDLINLKPKHRFFVGIDSDGCVFDTMDIKQKECFHPRIISHWRLESIGKYVRESAEFVNLYSKWRGQNRFLSLVRSMDLLRDRPEVIKSGVRLPDLSALKELIDSGLPLSNSTLEQRVRETRDKELASVLRWSDEVNADVAKTAKNIPPFKWVRESLQKLYENADIVVVSQTPCEALVREWEEHDIMNYVQAIAGQELGTKSELLEMATKDRYPPGKILMIGDAPGDRLAAKANNALFYPVNPGREETSWQRFHNEACDRFLTGSYAGTYEQTLIDEFESLLPEIPPWRKQ